MIEKEAMQFFHEVDAAFKEINLTYFLILGTLLGAIREQRFIPIDKDMDIGVFYEEYNEKKDKLIQLLENKNFSIYRKFHDKQSELNDMDTGINIKKNLTEIIHCDVCAFKKIKNWRYYPRQLSHKNKAQGIFIYPAKEMENLKEINFYQKKVLVFTNSELILELTYGKDWTIPHKEFKASKFLCEKFPKNGDEFWWAK